MKKLQFVKIKCQCGRTNSVPAFKVLKAPKKLYCELCEKEILRCEEKRLH